MLVIDKAAAGPLLLIRTLQRYYVAHLLLVHFGVYTSLQIFIEGRVFIVISFSSPLPRVAHLQL